MCLAYGADPRLADLTQKWIFAAQSSWIASTIKALVNAFDLEIEPHVDQEMKRQVMDTSWLPSLPNLIPTAQNSQ